MSDLILTSVSRGASALYFSGGAGIVGRGYAATVEQVKRELAPLPLALVSEMQPDAPAEIVLQSYLKSLDMGVGDPQLPLVTDGSVCFRMEKPDAPGYLQCSRRYLDDPMPYRIVEKGDLEAVLPILLRRNENDCGLLTSRNRGRLFIYFKTALRDQSIATHFCVCCHQRHRF